MKQKKSLLDPFAAHLGEMDLAKKTLAEMQAWLREEGRPVALSTISDWLASEHQRRSESQLLAGIAHGSRMNRELNRAYRQNPEPQIERLIQVTRSLILSLQVKGAAQPSLLSLANAMQKTVLDYLSAATRAKLEERKLGLQERRVAVLEKRAAQADATESVIAQNLSPEEREAAIREIYGR